MGVSYIPKAGGGGGGVDAGDTGVLATSSYQPSMDITVSGSSMTDLAATDALVTFTAPASGAVKVKVGVMAHYTATGNCFLGLRESTSTVGTRFLLSGMGTSEYLRINETFSISGLTPGSSHTYKAAAKVSSGTLTVYTNAGANCPIDMEVTAIPS